MHYIIDDIILQKYVNITYIINLNNKYKSLPSHGLFNWLCCKHGGQLKLNFTVAEFVLFYLEN